MTASSGGFFASLPSVSRNLQIVSVTLLFAASTCMAQHGTPAAEPASPPTDQTNATTITVPAGTHVAMALTHPVDSHSTHRGDDIFAQTTSPVIVSKQVVIPAGTFVQGKIEKMARRGSRGELLMQSLSVVFPNGYVAVIQGPLNMESDEGTAWNNPTSAAKAGIIAAPLAGVGIGTAIGASQHTTSTLGGTTITSVSTKALAIGSLVGLAAGGAVSLVLLARSHHFYVQEGSPVELSLPQPVTLAQAPQPDAESASSIAVTPAGLPRSPMPASAEHGTCYIPGRPGTPATYIPGTPATGDSPGTPGTYIPGTPPSPPIAYACP